MADTNPNEAEVSPRALAAYNNAVYLSAAMGFGYDADTGTMTVSYDGFDGKKHISGSPGEVLTEVAFWFLIPRVRTEADLVDLAFELGFLVAKNIQESSKDG